MSEFCREQGKKNEKGLEIGDRVEVLRNENGIDTGTKGTIIEISDYIIGVELDEYEGGHSCGGKGKKGHCRCINSEFLRKIEEKEVEKMSEFKLGDRVEVISEPIDGKNLFGEMGKVVASIDAFDGISRASDLIGVEFDNNILGHDCSSCGKDGHCWWVVRTGLKKVEDISEETKADTLEQKILEALREEIGVEIGEEFDVYENGEKKWICRFEVRGFSHLINGEFYKSKFWKNLVCDFHNYQFMIKPFIPKEQEDYWYFGTKDSNDKLLFLKVLKHSWRGRVFDYGMLALGNVFRTEEDALKNEDKILKRMEKLRNGEKS